MLGGAEAADLPVEAEVRLELMLAAVAEGGAVVAKEDAAAVEADLEAAGGVDLVADVGPVVAGEVGVPDRKTAASWAA